MSRAPSQFGIFIKTPSPHIVEVAATTGIDFAVLDAEHAPFDRGSIDVAMLAGRASALPILVRTADASPSTVLNALDLGAVGLVIPHVDTADAAKDLVQAARFRGGRRGYSSGPRAAGYGTKKLAEALDLGDRAKLIVQIEHPDAVSALDEITSVQGVDGILVGRADLALSMGHEDLRAKAVDETVRRVVERAHKRVGIVGIVASSKDEAVHFEALGANWFLIGSDHRFLQDGVRSWMSQ